MNCDRVHTLLDAHLDEELDRATDAKIEQHLRGCPTCSGRAAEREVLHTSIERLPRHTAPAHLHSAVRRSLSALEQAPAPPSPRRVGVWLTGALAALAFVAGVWIATPARLEDPRDEVIARHIASLATGQAALDVSSDDRHVVKPWFAGKIDLAPPVRNLADRGFALVGGRIDQVAGRKAAAVIYRIRRHEISVFVMRTADLREQPTRVSTLRGFSLATWTRDGLSFTAVSDVDARELRRFADLFQGPGP